MRHAARRSDGLFRRRSVSRGWWRRGRFRLTVAVLCGLAAASLAVPATSVTGRLLAGARSVTGRTPAVPGLANLTGRSPSPATSTAANAVGSCSELYFVSARGSGETSTGTSDESASAETEAAYKDIKHQLKAQGANPSTTFYQLPYSAPSTKVLTSGLEKPTSVSTLGVTVMSDWIQLMDVNLPKYIAGEEQGESELYAYLAQIYHTCNSAGKQPMVVLAGFSQGSMVVHNVLNTIAANNQTNLMAMIKGAVLIADPERMPNSDVANFGTALPSDYGICHALDILPIDHSHVSASCVPPGNTTDVASYFSSVAYQVCDTNDLVCDTSGLFKLKRDVPSFTNVFAFMTDVHLGTQTHTLSYTSGEMRTAGRRVARSLVLDGLGSQPSPSPSPSTSAPSGSGSWTAAELPLPGDAVSGNALLNLSDVVCESANFCVAVGNYYGAEMGGDALIERFNGQQWGASAAPLPSQLASVGMDSTSLGSVACTSATSCVAVGSWEDAKQNGGVLIETLGANGWTAAEGPMPDGGSGGGLGSISCASTSFCVAVGQYNAGSSSENAGLIETLDNGIWTASEAPAPAGGSSVPLLSVSCGAVGFCASVNEFNTTIDTLTNGTWTATNAPLPANAGGQGEGLYSIACPSADSCAAVGNYRIGEQSQGLLEDLSDGTWTAIQAPLPTDAVTTDSASFNSVSCSSAQSCHAAGIYNEPLDPDWGEAVIDTLSNGNWAPASSDNDAGLEAASCTAKMCTAAGYYGAESSGLIATNSTGTWTMTDVPLPTNASTTSSPEANLASVSCTTAGFCAAIGWYKDSTGNSQGLVITN